MRKLSTVGIIFFILAGTFQVMGQGIAPGDKCPTVPRDKGISVETLKAKVEALGFVVRRARIDAEIDFTDLLVGFELGRLAFQRDAAGLQHVSIVGNAERERDGAGDGARRVAGFF